MLDSLSPRERQIMELLYVRGEGTVGAVRAAMPVSLTEQAVRAMLMRLQEKGFVQRRSTEGGITFWPTMAKADVKASVLERLVNIFFDGSPASAASALLGMSENLDEKQLDELERMISEARARRRK